MGFSHVHGIYGGSEKYYLGDMVTVGIVEDDATVREAIRDYCNAQHDLSCTLAKESAERFLDELTDESVPDVVLMDIGLPGMSGINAIRLIKDRFPAVSIIMLTVYMDTQKIFDSLCAGATGYLLKTTPFPEIKEAILVAYKGGGPMSPQIARRVIEHFHPGRREEFASVLTSKEKEVVLGLVEGLSYKMIAERMGVGMETIRSHIKNIYAKLHVHGKAEVISKSLKGEI